jgi:hypothetical protein
VERPRRVVRLARLIHRSVRDLDGSFRPLGLGGNLKPVLVATQGGKKKLGHLDG